MKKQVIGRNVITGFKFSPTFYDDNKMYTWIEKQKADGEAGQAWGRRARHYKKDECPEDRTILIVEEYEKLIEAEYERPVWELDGEGDIVLDGNGNPVQAVDGNGDPIFETVPAEYETWVRLDPEWEYTIEDLTVEHDAELQEKAERATEIAELKQAYNVINGWTSMGDISLPFLKKFFIRILKEMRD